MTTTSEPATTPERPNRSVPKPVFTDAEAGAQTFPDSGPDARRFNYYTSARRKQTHYEDVTVEVQPDPRHYLSQGWIYGFANGDAGYPLHWTKLKAWGVDEPAPVRGVGSGGGGKDLKWPAHGWHEFRDPNEDWELTLYRYNANVVRQVTQNIENAVSSKAFSQWSRNWIHFVERHVGAWMHVEHILGLYVFAAANRSGPTNMHNTAIAVNSMHKIRFAQDLALYNLTLSEEIPEFDGTAHLGAWNADPVWQGVRNVTEALTAIEDDWGSPCSPPTSSSSLSSASCSAATSSCRSRQATATSSPRPWSAPASSTTPSATCAGPRPCFGLLTRDREFAEHNIDLMQGWLAAWVPRCIEAARVLQPIWSQPDAKPPRFEDSLDAAKNRFADIVKGLGLQTPKELSL